MGLGTLITRTTDTVLAATTSAARAVTAATTSAAGATGGAALGAGLGLCAAPPMVSGTARKKKADQPPPPPSPSRRSRSPAFWTGRWYWPPAAPPFWSTGSPRPRASNPGNRVRPSGVCPAAPATTRLRFAFADHPPPGKGRQKNPDAAIPGRGGPAATRSDPPTCTCTCPDEGIAG